MPPSRRHSAVPEDDANMNGLVSSVIGICPSNWPISKSDSNNPHSSIASLDMLDELPEIRDTDVTTAMIDDASCMVPETSSATCSEI